MKSSNTLTFLSLVPAKCQSSPNSPPPRIFGTARIALYRWQNVIIIGLKNGLMEMLNPPYPEGKHQ